MSYPFHSSDLRSLQCRTHGHFQIHFNSRQCQGRSTLAPHLSTLSQIFASLLEFILLEGHQSQNVHVKRQATHPKINHHPGQPLPDYGLVRITRNHFDGIVFHVAIVFIHVTSVMMQTRWEGMRCNGQTNHMWQMLQGTKHLHQ